jgi:hypothetical protein
MASLLLLLSLLLVFFFNSSGVFYCRRSLMFRSSHVLQSVLLLLTSLETLLGLNLCSAAIPTAVDFLSAVDVPSAVTVSNVPNIPAVASVPALVLSAIACVPS